VACGSGRHALPLARGGCAVTAVDVSAEAIEFLRGAAGPVEIDARVGDMARLAAGIVADAAICMGNAFGYLEHQDTVRFLGDLTGIVVPGGTLVVDTGFMAESLLPGLELEEPPMTIGGVEAESVNTYDTAHSRWLTAFTFRRGAEVHRARPCSTSTRPPRSAAWSRRPGSPSA
jgi:hypothetical protein